MTAFHTFSHILDFGDIGEHSVTVEGEYIPADTTVGLGASFDLFSVYYQPPADTMELSPYRRRFINQFVQVNLYPALTSEAEDMLSEAGRISYETEVL